MATAKTLGLHTPAKLLTLADEVPPNSDRESVTSYRSVSALPSKADMCGANHHVCFGP